MAGGSRHEAEYLPLAHPAPPPDPFPAPGPPIPEPPPADRCTTPMGIAFLDDLPPFMREDPDVMAVQHAYARELERLEAYIELVRRQFFPSTADLLLGVYETMMRTTVAPPGMTIENRRLIIEALLVQLTSIASSLAWQGAVTGLVGSGWSYVTHDVDDPANTPPAGTIRVVLPGSATSDRALQAVRLLRDITPAGKQLQIVFGAGFQLDLSQLDVDALVA